MTKAKTTPLNPPLKTALVTGASAGIGEDIALRLAKLGYTVYAAARRTERMAHLTTHGIQVVHLDITDPQSIATGLATTGPIDILVNNAGYGSYGAIEEVPITEARRQFEVNIFGLAHLTQLVIPHMRQQRAGRIINISSIGGLAASPYGGWYHATKFALEALTSALRQELAPFGVRVIVIRPGAIKSEWAAIAAQSALNVSGKGPYKQAVSKLHELFTSSKLEGMAAEPSVIADAVEKAVTSHHPRNSYTAPRLARIMVRLSLTATFFGLSDTLNRKFLGLPKTM